MKIYDLASPFLNSYEPNAEYYENYFTKHEEVFNYYFDNNHCVQREIKLEKALIQHPEKIEEMKWIAQTIPSKIRVYAPLLLHWLFVSSSVSQGRRN